MLRSILNLFGYTDLRRQKILSIDGREFQKGVSDGKIKLADCCQVEGCGMELENGMCQYHGDLGAYYLYDEWEKV